CRGRSPDRPAAASRVPWQRNKYVTVERKLAGNATCGHGVVVPAARHNRIVPRVVGSLDPEQQQHFASLTSSGTVMPDGSNTLTLLRDQRGRPQAAVPAGTRVYAIGDIHGHVGLVRRLHQLIRTDMAERPAERSVVVYLGDYVDRGPESRATIEL